MNFFRFFYKGIIKREMFDRKEIPDNIPPNHVLTQRKKHLNNFMQIQILLVLHGLDMQHS